MRKIKNDDEVSYWQSMADLLTALLLIILLLFLLFMVYYWNKYDGKYEAEATTAVYDRDKDQNYKDSGGNAGGGKTTHGSGGGKTAEATTQQPEGTKKAAVYVVMKDKDSKKKITEAGIPFTLFRGSEQLTLFTHYPEEKGFDEFLTREDGSFFLPEMIHTGNYELQQEAAPKGYEKKNTWLKISKEYDWSHPYMVEVLLGPVKNRIWFDTPEDASGVFTVTAAENIKTADGTLRYKKGEIVDRIDIAQKRKSKKLYPGKYMVTETQTPEFYKTSDPEAIDVREKGKIIKTISPQKTVFSFRVCDENYPEEGLNGIEFRISDHEKVLSGKNGEVSIEDLKKNTTYTVEQVTYKKGYLHKANTFSFSVDQNGNTKGPQKHTNRILRAEITLKDKLLRKNITGERVNSGKKEWTSGMEPYVWSGISAGKHTFHFMGNTKTVTIHDTAEIQEITLECFTWADKALILVLILIIFSGTCFIVKKRRK